MAKDNIIGLPCMGGKAALTKYICRAMDNYCINNIISRFIDACGGGGKIICSLGYNDFKEMIYNEPELALSCLLKVLGELSNIERISNTIIDLFGMVDSSNLDTAENINIDDVVQ